jgi:hypothetical protein
LSHEKARLERAVKPPRVGPCLSMVDDRRL